MPDHTIVAISPAAADLAESLVEHSIAASTAGHPDYAPGHYGGLSIPVGAILGGMSASGAALLIEGLVSDAIKAPAEAFLAAHKADIAKWLSPKLADLGAEFLGEFGSKAGVGGVIGYKR